METANLPYDQQVELIEACKRQLENYISDKITTHKRNGTVRVNGDTKVVVTYSAPEGVDNPRVDDVSWVFLEPDGYVDPISPNQGFIVLVDTIEELTWR